MIMPMKWATGPPMPDREQQRVLARLMAWLSPGFPVGAYAYSHGLEYAVEAGLVGDRGSLVRWIDGILDFGSGRLDAMLLCEAHRAAETGDGSRMRAVARRAAALRGSAELALESTAQGEAFAAAVSGAWPETGLDQWREDLAADGCRLVYPVAVGTASALAGLPLSAALTAYLHAFVANLVSAAVRLIPLGQSDGQKAVSLLEGAVLRAADEAVRRPYGTIGSAAPVVDWTSMRHETQEVRLFRS